MKLGENIHLMSALCCRNISLIGSKLWIFFALPSFWPVRFSLNHPLDIRYVACVIDKFKIKGGGGDAVGGGGKFPLLFALLCNPTNMGCVHHASCILTAYLLIRAARQKKGLMSRAQFTRNHIFVHKLHPCWEIFPIKNIQINILVYYTRLF